MVVAQIVLLFIHVLLNIYCSELNMDSDLCVHISGMVKSQSTQIRYYK